MTPTPSDVEVIDWACKERGWGPWFEERTDSRQWTSLGNKAHGAFPTLAAALPEMRRQHEEAHRKALVDQRHIDAAQEIAPFESPQRRTEIAQVIARHERKAFRCDSFKEIAPPASTADIEAWTRDHEEKQAETVQQASDRIFRKSLAQSEAAE